MRKLWICASLLCFIATSVQAQTGFEPKDVRAFLDAYSSSVKGGHIQPNWLPDGRFWYVDESNAERPVFLVETKTGDKSKLTNLRDLADEPLDVLSYSVQDKTFDLATTTKRYVFDISSQTLKDAGSYTPPSNPIVRSMFPMYRYDRREDKSPNGNFIASLDGPNLLIKSAETGDTLIRTDNGTEEFQWFYGYDIWENSDEAWSPDGTKFLARSHDMSSIKGIPIVDYLDDPSDVTRFRYWARAGEPLPVTRFAVFDAETRSHVDIDGGGSENEFAFFVRWLPDGGRFAFIRYTRDLKNQELVFANAKTGETKTILNRRVKSGWVKWPSGPIGLHFLGENAGFLWRSNESGYFHWYHHSMRGKRIGQVTSGDFDAKGIVEVDGDTVFFMGASDLSQPYDQHLLSVGLDGKGQQQLTKRPGQHVAYPSPDAKSFLIHHESLMVPPNSRLITSGGALIADLAAASVDQEKRFALPAPDVFSAKGADGEQPIRGVIFKPSNFDPSKRYPVIERIYGGMQSQVIWRNYPGAGYQSEGSEYMAMLAYLASKGFVVVTMDAPGTPGRGRDYNLDTYGTWPNGIIADHAAAMREVAETRPWMDLSRTGMAGNSFGGTLAGYAAAQAPDLYKAVSISVPDIDASDGVHWMEWQLGPEADNPENYAGKSAQALAAEMESELLIIAGTSDVNVPISNTMKLLDGLAEAGKPYELVLFPGTNHAHYGRGDRYAYAIARIEQFFKKHLGSPQP